MKWKSAGRLGVIATTISLIVVACSDVTKIVGPVKPEFLASGKTFTVVWAPDSNGVLRLAGMLETPVGKASRGNLAPIARASMSLDTSRAMMLQTSLSMARIDGPNRALLSFDPNIQGKDHGVTLKSRQAITGLIDGKRVSVFVAPSLDRSSHKPPRAFYTTVDGELSRLQQFTYAKKGGAWVVATSRTTVVGPNGKTLFVEDRDEQLVRYAGISSGFMSGPLRIATAIVALAQPDALHSETLEEANVRCATQLGALAAATVLATYKTAKAIALQGLTAAALEASVAASAACVLDVAACPAAAAAVTAYNLAKAAEVDAWVVSAEADAAVALASSALWDCIWNPPAGGGGEDCSGATDYCDVNIYQDGTGEWHITGTACGCERTYEE
jgi:hypothetical protein